MRSRRETQAGRLDIQESDFVQRHLGKEPPELVSGKCLRKIGQIVAGVCGMGFVEGAPDNVRAGYLKELRSRRMERLPGEDAFLPELVFSSLTDARNVDEGALKHPGS